MNILGAEWNDNKAIKNALLEVDYTMLKFLERHEIYEFVNEEDAISAVCGSEATDEVICIFTRDAKISKNVAREKTTEKRRVFSTGFQNVFSKSFMGGRQKLVHTQCFGHGIRFNNKTV